MEKDKVDQAVWFPEWALVLQREPLPVARREQYRQTLLDYFHHCKLTGQRATVRSARTFVEKSTAQHQPSTEQVAEWKEALNWFFRTARCHKPSLRGVPPLARADLGKAEWERRLIRRLRMLHYQWRTEGSLPRLGLEVCAVVGAPVTCGRTGNTSRRAHVPRRPGDPTARVRLHPKTSTQRARVPLAPALDVTLSLSKGLFLEGTEMFRQAQHDGIPSTVA